MAGIKKKIYPRILIGGRGPANASGLEEASDQESCRSISNGRSDDSWRQLGAGTIGDEGHVMEGYKRGD
ncbi:hypothetical protein ACLOJK_021602 [Asimina triloba]